MRGNVTLLIIIEMQLLGFGERIGMVASRGEGWQGAFPRELLPKIDLTAQVSDDRIPRLLLMLGEIAALRLRSSHTAASLSGDTTNEADAVASDDLGVVVQCGDVVGVGEHNLLAVC